MALAGITLFQFFVFPGHSWLTARSNGPDTTVYVPMIERVAAPGFLSRDLVATHPTLANTAYDEATLFVAKAGKLSFKRSLEIQQLLFRFAAVLGVFLLARAARLNRLHSLLVAAAANFGAWVAGAGVAVVDPDPAPYTFAFALVLLAAGLLSTERPLLAGLAGGISLLYDFRLAVPFWLLVIAASGTSAPWKRMMRASLPVLAVFGLLLANLAQLQPGITEPQFLWGKVPVAIAAIQQFRSPQLLVRSWGWASLGASFVVCCCCVWGTVRIRSHLTEPGRWLFAGLPLLGVLTVLLTVFFAQDVRWYAIAEIQPGILLLFPFAFCSISCAIAFFRREMRRMEAAALLVVVTALPFTLPKQAHDRNVAALAHWALASTWGGSMFLFPDAGCAADPAVFRAESQRAVWVDWNSGKLVNTSDSFADEWYRRWQDTMSGPYSTARLAGLLSLPIDYYVLQRGHEVKGVTPVFTDSQFVVYEANSLRAALH